MEEPIFEKWTPEQFKAKCAEVREVLQPCIGRPVTIDEKLWRINEIYVDGGSLKVDCTYYDGRNFIEDKGMIMEFGYDDLIENITESIPKVIALNEAERAELNNEYT